MPGENLTRIEAQERSAIISVERYRVELDLRGSGASFESITRVSFACSEPGSESFIDAITDSVSSIVLNGRELDPATHSDGTRISLPGLAAQNELEIRAQARYMNTGEGLHRFVDPVDGETYLYTQFEVPDSRRMFAVFEQPDLKAEFAFHIKAPAHWQVVSNSPTPEPVALADGGASWEFAPTPRISSYITALIAGPYEVVRSSLVSSSGRTIPLGVFSRKSLSQYVDADYIFQKTREGFEFFESAFGVAYPFEKYDQLFVPEFNAGAMENAGAVTFTETYVFRSQVADSVRERRVITILHELAHMWFGDLVTMRWWNDLWLNESFAEYASHLALVGATEWKEAWTTFLASEKSWAYRQDQLPSTHPIVAEIRDLEDVQVNFDGITYAKGASVLKQLVAWVGEDKFLEGVRRYFERHAYGNTELADLLVELEAASGRKLGDWSKQWLETAGVNTLRAEFEVDAAGRYTSFAIRQSAIEEHPQLRPHRLAIGCYDLVAGKVQRVARFEVDIDGPRTELAELVGVAKPGLLLLNDDDLTYAKIRLDADSWRFALEHLSEISDPLARGLVWGAAWDATRDAEASARDFIALVLGNIASETESTTITILLRQLLGAGSLYVSAKHRVGELERIAAGLLELARSAEPGSDSQLQFVKFFAQTARTESQLIALRDLLAGRGSVPGLLIEADLRWELLTGLVVGGAATEAEIDAELAKDNTANGQKAAAAARAALPSVAAKERAWAQLVESEELSNALVNSASLGFGRVLDESLLSGFVARYFEATTRVWESKTYQIANYLLTNLYPMALANRELETATKRWLDGPGAAQKPALRRIIIEHLSNLQRALAAQERDSA